MKTQRAHGLALLLALALTGLGCIQGLSPLVDTTDALLVDGFEGTWSDEDGDLVATVERIEGRKAYTIVHDGHRRTGLLTRIGGVLYLDVGPVQYEEPDTPVDLGYLPAHSWLQVRLGEDWMEIEEACPEGFDDLVEAELGEGRVHGNAGEGAMVIASSTPEMRRLFERHQHEAGFLCNATVQLTRRP